MLSSDKRRKKEGVRTLITPLPLLIKGQSGGSAAPPNQSKQRKGRRRGRPSTSTRVGPASCLHHRDPKRMEDAWRASRAEAKDEATSPPLESGGGRLAFPNK